MDQFYKIDAVIIELQKIYEDQKSSDADIRNLRRDLSGYQIIKSDDTAIYHLCERDVDAEWELKTYLMTGVLTEFNLLPNLKVRGVPTAAVQSVTISGLNTTGFTESTYPFDLVVELFRDYLGGRKCKPAISGSRSSQLYGAQLEFTNRVLTPIHQAGTASHIPFSKEEDPQGYWTDICIKGTHIRVSDSKVKLGKVPPGKEESEPAEVRDFAIGDIVTVQFVIVAVPNAEGESVIKLQLRSLVKNSDRERKEAVNARTIAYRSCPVYEKKRTSSAAFLNTEVEDYNLTIKKARKNKSEHGSDNGDDKQ